MEESELDKFEGVQMYLLNDTKHEYKICFNKKIIEFSQEANLELSFKNTQLILPSISIKASELSQGVSEPSTTSEISSKCVSYVNIIFEISDMSYHLSPLLSIKRVPYSITGTPSEDSSTKKQEFQEKIFFLSLQNLDSFLRDVGVTKTTQSTIKTSSYVMGSYGSLLTIMTNSLTELVISLNIVKILALLPFKLPRRFLDVLALFSVLGNDGVTHKLLDDHIYSETEIEERRLYLVNSRFNFRAIFMRNKGSNIIIRWVLNLAFLAISVKLSHSGKGRGTRNGSWASESS